MSVVPLYYFVAKMGRKQKTILRTRFLTDIVSRWKTGATIYEINDKLEEYTRVGGFTDEDHNAFVQSFHDRIYEILVEEYQADVRHKRATVYDLASFVNQDVVYPSIRARLRDQIRVWIKAERDLFYTLTLEKYMVLLMQGTTFDELMTRVGEDTNDHHVRRKLWRQIEQWERVSREAERPANELGRMAQDAQNIHTLAVSRQTNVMFEQLAAIAVPPGQKTMSEILGAWTAAGLEATTVERDMRSWAAKSYVVEEGDFLYRKTLRAVWAKIQTYPVAPKKELVRRLWEECSDAVGMCAQGHIGRLLNVFVGFDEAYVAEESFQDTMAAISKMDVGHETKIQEATRVMDAMHMEDAARQPWLEAF